MNKEKLEIPFPDEQKIQTEIKRIVKVSLKPRQSFLAYVIQLYKTIGLKYLFINRREGLLLCFSILVMMIYLSSAVTKTAQDETAVYLFLFLVSPLIFTSLSLYDYFYKRHYETIEVEMTTKLNLYQVTAFKMLIFSVISIFLNMFCITILSIVYEEIHFIKAILISTTALFLFSIIFLAALMKKQTGWQVIFVIFGWVGFNITFIILQNHLYMNMLMTLPVFVYAAILIVSIIVYLQYLSKLVRMTPTKGV